MKKRPPLSPQAGYAMAVARVVLCATKALEECLDGAVRHRRLSNFLRGQQRPPPSRHDVRYEPASGTYGLFWSQNAGWVEVLLERLVEEGYLESSSGGLAATRAADRLLVGREKLDDGILPRCPLLGSNPEVEDRLWELRRLLAREQNRPVHGIFTNATLARLASAPPRNLGELAAVAGIGEQKLKTFGRRILAALKSTKKRRKDASG